MKAVRDVACWMLDVGALVEGAGLMPPRIYLILMSWFAGGLRSMVEIITP